MYQTREEKKQALLDDMYEEEETEIESVTLFHNCGTNVWLHDDGTYSVTIDCLSDPPTN